MDERVKMYVKSIGNRKLTVMLDQLGLDTSRRSVVAEHVLVQSFYGKKGVYLKQIATKGIFTGF